MLLSVYEDITNLLSERQLTQINKNRIIGIPTMDSYFCGTLRPFIL